MTDYLLTPQWQLAKDELLDRFIQVTADKGIELYSHQEEAILEIYAGKNVILNTPTGSGKSLVATALHFLSVSQQKRSFYTSPIKALVNEKFLSLCREFGPENVGMITGDASVNRDAPIICCTAEILANIALKEGDRAPIDDVILDEFHYYSDEDRGVAWQIPLINLSQCRFLLMSATIGDTDFFEERLGHVTKRETALIKSIDRPVPLDYSYRETPLEHTIGDLLEEGKAPIYVVSFTQRESAQNAQALLSTNILTKDEKQKIQKTLKSVLFKSPYGKEIKKFLSHGIGLHHAGLLPKYKILVETLAQKGFLKIICGTDTLGVGVNIPIRSVLLTRLCKFNGKKMTILSARDFHQIAGRAGRKGFDSHGSIILQAPEHVIENRKLAQKALLNPKKKFVRAKPPSKGFLPWDEKTFQKLIESPPERLTSQFKITHGSLLSLLSRETNGVEAARQLIRNSHESEVMKNRHRKRAFQLFRSLYEKRVVEIIPIEERKLTPVRVNIDLQEDFSLDQTLGIYLLDTLNQVDPFTEDYALQVLSLTESIIEQPRPILLKQVDKARGKKLAELKMKGVDYEERIAELEKVDYPKPMEAFIYETFNRFADKHPWLKSENIKPKSIAREMFENYQTFDEYIKQYDLQKVEGLLLRYLTEVYKVLLQTVPDALKNDDIDDMSIFFEETIKRVDSSLLDEWSKIRRGEDSRERENKTLLTDEPNKETLTSDLKKFEKVIKHSIFQFLKALAQKDYEEIFTSEIWTVSDPELDPKRLKEVMGDYYDTHGQICTDSRSRQNDKFLIEKKGVNWFIEAIITDTDDANDWTAKFTVNLTLSETQGRVCLNFDHLGPIGF